MGGSMRPIKMAVLCVLFASLALPLVQFATGMVLHAKADLSFVGGLWQSGPEAGRANMRLFAYVRSNTPKDALFLTFRQNDFAYYARGRKFIQHFDPEIAPLLGQRDKQKAWQWMRDRGIGYIVTPPYSLPTFYNTVVRDVVTDPTLTQLEVDDEGWRLFRVRSAPEAVNWGAATPLMSSIFESCPPEYQAFPLLCDSQRKQTYRIRLEDGRLHLRSDFWSAHAMTGLGDALTPPSAVGQHMPVEGDATYLFRAKVRGEGDVAVNAVFFDAPEQVISKPIPTVPVVSEVIVSDGWKDITGIFRTPPQARQLRMEFALGSDRSELVVRDAEIVPAGTVGAHPKPSIHIQKHGRPFY